MPLDTVCSCASPANRATSRSGTMRSRSGSFRSHSPRPISAGIWSSTGTWFARKGGGEPQDYRGPLQTWEFAPAPQGLPGSQARIFELPSGTYSRDATPPAIRTPPLMNIFLPPDTISETEFTRLADCLARHQKEINSALLRLRADFPYRSQDDYFPLRLGGIVRGMPPWSDPRYVEQIQSLYGDTEATKPLPDGGRFTLYRGQTASGVIDGKQIRLSILPNGKKQLWLTAPHGRISRPRKKWKRQVCVT